VHSVESTVICSFDNLLVFSCLFFSVIWSVNKLCCQVDEVLLFWEHSSRVKFQTLCHVWRQMRWNSEAHSTIFPRFFFGSLLAWLKLWTPKSGAHRLNLHDPEESRVLMLGNTKDVDLEPTIPLASQLFIVSKTAKQGVTKEGYKLHRSLLRWQAHSVIQVFLLAPFREQMLRINNSYSCWILNSLFLFPFWRLIYATLEK